MKLPSSGTYSFILLFGLYVLIISYRPTLSYQRLQTVEVLTDHQLYEKITRTVANKHELQVLESLLIFNKYAHLIQCLPPVEAYEYLIGTC